MGLFYSVIFRTYDYNLLEKVELVLDEFLKAFCNIWLEEEFSVQSGAESYERNDTREDTRAGHYRRSIITSRGVIDLRVPRGKKNKYTYSLFKKFKRKTGHFEEVVIDALLKGHSSRKASRFFAGLFGKGTISHQAAAATLRKFDYELERWKAQPLRDNALIVVLDAVRLKGVFPYIKEAKPVLFAYAVYPDGTEEVLGFEIARGESTNAWTKFCQKLYQRGLQNTKLIVRDDCDAITNAISLCWPNALDQQCVFHILQNLCKKLKGHKNKKKIINDASWLYEAQSEEEFYRWAGKFKKKYDKDKHHKAFKYFLGKIYQSIRYFELPKEYWRIARTSNRLERFFEELKRRIRVFRRFPNTQSCKRWLYALITEIKPNNTRLTNSESQQSS
ncbi:MAG: IS256 family transposase [Candidatus Omnitrophica bacterium]|nr:IS256 family transposase [Candidatus Omnitrophota bacterium]